MPNKNPSPKSVFIQNERMVKAHNRMLESQDFQTALETARAQYVHKLHYGAPTDLLSPSFGSGAAYAFERMQGMMDFIDILLNLGENNPPPARAEMDLNLKQPAAKN